MGFDANELPTLEYDFTKFGGRKAEIPEPTVEQVAEYWTDYIGLLRTQQAKSAQAASKDETVPEGPEDVEERIKQQVIDGKHRNSEMVGGRRELLARLCSDTPNLEELKALPHRVFNAFEAYVMEVLSPEASSTATTQ